MGCVYEAWDERLSRPVALKLLHTTDATSSARLRAEATVLARLHHPNLVTVFDTGTHDGRPFAVTELVRGQTLGTRMAEGPLPLDELARIGAQVASALAYAHEHGVIHRDVTPGNVLLTEAAGDARLIDFGIAVSRDAVALTATGVVIGTPAYLSPEQVEGRSATVASDAYSLGLVLIEGATGHRPFEGTPAESAGARLVRDAPVPEGLPDGWTSLLAALTRRDPDQRPEASDVARRLRALAVAGSPSPERGPAATVTPSATDVTSSAERSPTAVSAVLPGSTVTDTTPTLEHQRTSRHRRWPILVACVALAVGMVVLAALSQRAADGPATATDPTATATTEAEPNDGASDPPTTTASTPATSASTTGAVSSGPTIDEAVPGADPAATTPEPKGNDGPAGERQGKGKGKPRAG